MTQGEHPRPSAGRWRAKGADTAILPDRHLPAHRWRRSLAEWLPHPEDLEGGLAEVREELESTDPRAGRLRTLLSGIAAMAPGVGAVADAVLKVKAVLGL